MNKIKSILVMGLCAMMLTFTGCAKVPAGNAGVIVHLYGSNKGVDHDIRGVGRFYLPWNDELYLFPLFQQNYQWTKSPQEGSSNDESITFQTKEGMECNGDIGITFHIQPDKVSDLFVKYRQHIEEIRDQFLRNYVRDAFNTYAGKLPIEVVYGEGKADLIDSVEKYVNGKTAPDGIIVDKIYTIGSIRLPQQVTDALNAKITATQQAQQKENEVAKAKAQAQIVEAEATGKADSVLVIAKAQAEANRLLSASITPTLVSYKNAEQWDGHLPQYQMGGTPLINLGNGK